MAGYIDRLPPRPEGEPKKDNEALYNYLVFLREQINAIVASINKGDKNNGEK